MRIRTAALLGAVLLGSAICSRKAEAQGVIACESIDNRYRNCRVNTSGSARVDKQLSDTPCIYGRTWGFDYNSIWVDRGCRARFRVAGSGAGWESGSSGRRLTCESVDNRYNACDVNTRGDVRMVRQLSKDPCVAGRSWGFERNRIWVANGCRAEFEIGYYDVDWSDGNRSVKCESEDGRYRRCRVWTYGTVRIQRQLSQTGCRMNSNWGYDREGIWVNDGCRAIFFVGAGDGGWGGWKPPPGGGGGGSSLLDIARESCGNEARRRGYDRINVRNADQSGINANVDLRATRSGRQYDLRCLFESRYNRARLTSENQVGSGGGTGSFINRGRSACEQRALAIGYGAVSVRNAYQSGSNVNVEMSARQGNQNWNVRCVYRSSGNTATITEQSPGPTPR